MRAIIITIGILMVGQLGLAETLSDTSVLFNDYLNGNYFTKEQAQKNAQFLLLAESQTDDTQTFKPFGTADLHYLDFKLKELIETLKNGLGEDIQRDPEKVRNLDILLFQMDSLVKESGLASLDDRYLFKRKLALGAIVLASTFFGTKHMMGYFENAKVTMSALLSQLLRFGSVVYFPFILSRGALKFYLDQPSRRYPLPQLPPFERSLRESIAQARLQWCSSLMGDAKLR